MVSLLVSVGYYFWSIKNPSFWGGLVWKCILPTLPPKLCCFPGSSWMPSSPVAFPVSLPSSPNDIQLYHQTGKTRLKWGWDITVRWAGYINQHPGPNASWAAVCPNPGENPSPAPVLNSCGCLERTRYCVCVYFNVIGGFCVSTELCTLLGQLTPVSLYLEVLTVTKPRNTVQKQIGRAVSCSLSVSCAWRANLGNCWTLE